MEDLPKTGGLLNPYCDFHCFPMRKKMTPKQDYIKKMELKKQLKNETGIVSDHFPQVSNIVIQMTYFHDAENPVLMERTVNVFPSSVADFNMRCMIRGCEKGGFDLTKVIKGLVKNHKKIARGDMKCMGKLDNHAPNHARISYEINVKYNKQS